MWDGSTHRTFWKRQNYWEKSSNGECFSVSGVSYRPPWEIAAKQHCGRHLSLCLFQSSFGFIYYIHWSLVPLRNLFNRWGKMFEYIKPEETLELHQEVIFLLYSLAQPDWLGNA
jgi:hypothetical protein